MMVICVPGMIQGLYAKLKLIVETKNGKRGSAETAANGFGGARCAVV